MINRKQERDGLWDQRVSSQPMQGRSIHFHFRAIATLLLSVISLTFGLSALMGIGWVRMVHAQAQYPGTILVYPNATSYVAGRPLEFSGKGTVLALDQALSAAPAGAYISVPAGYAETPTTTHTLNKANTTLEFAPGVSIKAGASGLSLFTIKANNVSIKGAGPLDPNGIDGQYSSAKLKGVTAISIGVGLDHVSVSGLTVHNLNGEAVSIGGSGTNNYVGFNHFTDIGDGSKALLTGQNAISFQDQDQLIIENNEARRINGNFIAGGNGFSPAYRGGRYDVRNNYGGQIYRMGIEILSTVAPSFAITFNTFDGFSDGGECISVSNTPQAGIYIPFTQGNSALVGFNHCGQPQASGPGSTHAGYGLEIFSDDIIAINNDIQGFFGEAIVLQGGGTVAQNHIFGADAGINIGPAGTPTPLTVFNNNVIETRSYCIEAIGDKPLIDKNQCVRTPGYFTSDATSTYFSLITSGSMNQPSVSGPATVTGNTFTLKSGIPIGPVVTPTGTTGSTSYTYKVVANHGTGAASTGGTTIAGNAVLSRTNLNRLTWTTVDGATGYDIYRISGGTTTGKIASTNVGTLDDTGLLGDGMTPPDGAEIPAGFAWQAVRIVDAPNVGTAYSGNLFANENVTAFGLGFAVTGALSMNGTSLHDNRYQNLSSIGRYFGSTDLDYSGNRTLAGRGFANPVVIPNAWGGASPYEFGQQVSYGGMSYVSIHSGAGQRPDISPRYWRKYAPGDQPGWAAGTAYTAGDYLDYGGKQWVALTSGIGRQPDRSPGYWAQTAATDGTVTPVSFSGLYGTHAGTVQECVDCQVSAGLVYAGGPGGLVAYGNGGWTGLSAAGGFPAAPPTCVPNTGNNVSVCGEPVSGGNNAGRIPLAFSGAPAAGLLGTVIFTKPWANTNYACLAADNGNPVTLALVASTERTARLVLTGGSYTGTNSQVTYVCNPFNQ